MDPNPYQPPAAPDAKRKSHRPSTADVALLVVLQLALSALARFALPAMTGRLKIIPGISAILIGALVFGLLHRSDAKRESPAYRAWLAFWGALVWASLSIVFMVLMHAMARFGSLPAYLFPLAIGLFCGFYFLTVYLGSWLGTRFRSRQR
jgi:hypothetical protein